MGPLFDALVSVPPPVVLALVFLLPALGPSAFVGLFVPGEVAVLLGGVLAPGCEGRASSRPSPWSADGPPPGCSWVVGQQSCEPRHPAWPE